MINQQYAPYAILALRVVTGALFLYHGLVKLFVFTPAGTFGYFESLGLPGVLGYATMLIEIFGGIALIVGLFTAPLSLVLAVVLVGSAIFGHGTAGFGWSNPGGGVEYPLMWAVVQAALAFLGDGAYALRPGAKKA